MLDDLKNAVVATSIVDLSFLLKFEFYIIYHISIVFLPWTCFFILFNFLSLHLSIRKFTNQ